MWVNQKVTRKKRQTFTIKKKQLIQYKPLSNPPIIMKLHINKHWQWHNVRYFTNHKAENVDYLIKCSFSSNDRVQNLGTAGEKVGFRVTQLRLLLCVPGSLVKVTRTQCLTCVKSFCLGNGWQLIEEQTDGFGWRMCHVCNSPQKKTIPGRTCIMLAAGVYISKVTKGRQGKDVSHIQMYVCTFSGLIHSVECSTN